VLERAALVTRLLEARPLEVTSAQTNKQTTNRFANRLMLFHSEQRGGLVDLANDGGRAVLSFFADDFGLLR
jgi:hypothetical protein